MVVMKGVLKTNKGKRSQAREKTAIENTTVATAKGEKPRGSYDWEET